MQHKEQRGFLTIAQNSNTGDYLRMAYAQALSIKLTQKINRYAVIVDRNTKDQIEGKHLKVFDYVIELPEDNSVNEDWKLSNEPQVFWLTPFKETLKIESDILFGRNVDHWWQGLQHKDVYMPIAVRDYRGNIYEGFDYRKVHASNNLPNIYTGLMYFRYSKDAYDFFVLCNQIYNNWSWFRDEFLVNHKENQITTDVAYAVAALIFGEERCTCPVLEHITFVHMKGAVQGWAIGQDWEDKIYFELDGTKIKLGFNDQLYPVHYQKKNFISDELIDQYEFQFRRNT